MSAHLTIDMQIASTSQYLPSKDEFHTWAAAAVGNLREHAEISLRIVDLEEGTALNKHWRNKNTPTNVLSFPSDLPPELGLPLLGDIVICAPVIEREASQQHKQLQSHWAHMVIHGILHLLGFDHLDDQQAEIMETLEKNIMETLNFCDPYKDDDS